MPAARLAGSVLPGLCDWSSEYTRLTAAALTRPVPGSTNTAPSANLLSIRSLSVACLIALAWTSGSSEVTTVYPPRRRLSQRAAGLVPNAGCRIHHCRKMSQKKPQSLCAAGTDTQSLGSSLRCSATGAALAAAACAGEMSPSAAIRSMT